MSLISLLLCPPGKVEFATENSARSPRNVSGSVAQERFLFQGPGLQPGAWGGERLISSHLTQFAGPRRRLMSSLRPQSHRYHFPNQVTKLVLKPLQRGRATVTSKASCRPSGPFLLPAAPPASVAGTSEEALSPFRVPPSPKCLMPQNETHHSKRGTIGGGEIQQWQEVKEGTGEDHAMAVAPDSWGTQEAKRERRKPPPQATASNSQQVSPMSSWGW